MKKPTIFTDDDILYKRLLENKRRSSINRYAGLRKHRGRIRSLPANYSTTMQKPSRHELKSLNTYIPKLDPSGPNASRIKDYAEKVSKFQRVADFRKSNDGEKIKFKQEYNPKPRHWPPHSYQNVVTYVKNGDCKFSANNTTAKEKLVATESRTLRKKIYPNSNERRRERRKSVKRELNFAIKNAQRQNMQHQIFVDADYVRGKENTNTLEGIVQPKKNAVGLSAIHKETEKGEFPFPAAYMSTQYREIIIHVDNTTKLNVPVSYVTLFDK